MGRRAAALALQLLVLLAASPGRAPRGVDGLRARAPHRRAAPPRARARLSSTSAFGSDAITVSEGDTAIIVGVHIKQDKYKTLEGEWSVDDSLDELERLCETAGLDIAFRETQMMQHPSPSTFIGPGKLEEIVGRAAAVEGVRAVVFDEELSPAQSRNLQAAFSAGSDASVLVLDRTQLILQIFAQRARTREAKLQVQVAQMRYMLPRLQTFLTTGAGMDAKGGSAGGGGGGSGGAFLRGAGETQLEMDKRLFRKQISRLEAEIGEVQAQRERFRKKRSERDTLPIVAIVGYTNAGKSTLLNKLCGSAEVYADDLLFATLDPTTRCVRLPAGREALFSDTVGFIQKLPTRLVSAFRATLDELEDASIVLHVVDAASPRARQQVVSVQEIIAELGAGGTPQLLVLNKADVACEPGGALGGPGGCELGELAPGSPLAAEWLGLHGRVAPSGAVLVSAHSGEGLHELLLAVEAALLRLAVPVECILPYSAGDLLAEIHRDGTISEEDYREAGTYVKAHVPRSLCNRLAKYDCSGAAP